MHVMPEQYSARRIFELICVEGRRTISFFLELCKLNCSNITAECVTLHVALINQIEHSLVNNSFASD